MALIDCPECGKMISDKAISCPNCGYVLQDDEIYDENEIYDELYDEDEIYDEDEMVEKGNSQNTLYVCMLVLGFVAYFTLNKVAVLATMLLFGGVIAIGIALLAVILNIFSYGKGAELMKCLFLFIVGNAVGWIVDWFI